MFSSHSLDEDFGVLIDEHMWHGLLRVHCSVQGVDQGVLLWNRVVIPSVVDDSSLDES
jgi:hypothetical protein